jgi:hypothetical protein
MERRVASLSSYRRPSSPSYWPHQVPCQVDRWMGCDRRPIPELRHCAKQKTLFIIGILSMRGSQESQWRRAFERRVAQTVAAPSPALPAAPLRVGRPRVSRLAMDRRYAVPGLEISIDPMTLMFDLCVESAVTTLAATLDRSLDRAAATAPSSRPPPPSAYRSMGRRAAKHAPSCRP